MMTTMIRLRLRKFDQIGRLSGGTDQTSAVADPPGISSSSSNCNRIKHFLHPQQQPFADSPDWTKK